MSISITQLCVSTYQFLQRLHIRLGVGSERRGRRETGTVCPRLLIASAFSRWGSTRARTVAPPFVVGVGLVASRAAVEFPVRTLHLTAAAVRALRTDAARGRKPVGSRRTTGARPRSIRLVAGRPQLTVESADLGEKRKSRLRVELTSDDHPEYQKPSA